MYIVRLARGYLSQNITFITKKSMVRPRASCHWRGRSKRRGDKSTGDNQWCHLGTLEWFLLSFLFFHSHHLSFAAFPYLDHDSVSPLDMFSCPFPSTLVSSILHPVCLINYMCRLNHSIAGPIYIDRWPSVYEGVDDEPVSGSSSILSPVGFLARSSWRSWCWLCHHLQRSNLIFLPFFLPRPHQLTCVLCFMFISAF